MTLHCPHCGGAITALVGANPDAKPTQPLAQSGANPGATSEIAQEILTSDLEPSPNGASAYNKGYEQDFLAFWGAYPLHRDKRKAQIAWRKSVTRLAQSTGANRRTANAQILAGAIRYRDDPNRDDAFTKYAEGWLNGDGWEDEPLPFRLRSQEPRDNAAAILRRAQAKGGSRGSLPG